jgi:hypothetical protein
MSYCWCHGVDLSDLPIITDFCHGRHFGLYLVADKIDGWASLHTLADERLVWTNPPYKTEEVAGTTAKLTVVQSIRTDSVA